MAIFNRLVQPNLTTVYTRASTQRKIQIKMLIPFHIVIK